MLYLEGTWGEDWRQSLVPLLVYRTVSGHKSTPLTMIVQNWFLGSRILFLWNFTPQEAVACQVTGSVKYIAFYWHVNFLHLTTRWSCNHRYLLNICRGFLQYSSCSSQHLWNILGRSSEQFLGMLWQTGDKRAHQTPIRRSTDQNKKTSTVSPGRKWSATICFQTVTESRVNAVYQAFLMLVKSFFFSSLSCWYTV